MSQNFDTMIRSIFKNFFSLVSVQLISALFGIMTIPLLINKIGVDSFGVFSVYLSIATMINLTVDFGVSISGVKSVVALNGKNIKNYILSVFIVRLVIFIFLFSLFFLYVSLIENDLYAIFFMFFSFSAVFQVNYFFKAIQKMWVITVITFTYRFTSFLLIFFVENLDLYSAALYFCLPYFIVSIFSLFYALLSLNVESIELKLESIVKVFLGSYHMFIAVFGSTLYRNLTIPLLALFLSTEVVGVFSAIEKVLKGIQGIINSLAESLFPIVCGSDVLKNRYKTILILTFLFTLILMSTVSVVLYFNVDLIGGFFSEYTKLILISLASSFTVGSMCFFIGVLYFFPQRLDKSFSRITVSSGVVSVVMIFIFGSLDLKVLMLLTPLLTEILIFFLLIIKLKHNGK